MTERDTKLIRITEQTNERMTQVKQDLLKDANKWDASYNDIINHLIDTHPDY